MARLFQQILSQNLWELAAAMVAAHHLFAAFPPSCCEAAAVVVSAHHLFARGLLARYWRFVLRVGCFGRASPAGPPFLQSTRPVLFLFWWLVLQSLLCVLPLPSKTRSRAVCWGPYCFWAALPAAGCSSCFEVCLLFELLLRLLKSLWLLYISFVQAAFEEVQAYLEFILFTSTVNYVLFSSLFQYSLYFLSSDAKSSSSSWSKGTSGFPKFSR